MKQAMEFSVRYHQLKQSLQKVVEVEYAKAVTEVRVVQDALSEVRRTKADVRAAMSTMEVSDWPLWQAYLSALEQSERHQEEKLVIAGERQQTVQAQVGAAFRESYKWGRVVDQLNAEAKAHQQRKEQSVADERAAQRPREER